MTHTRPHSAPVADALPGHWVYRLAPGPWQPYLKLARLDRPAGVWLLLWPCLWSLLLASPVPGVNTLWLALLFAVGALVMRGAGCTYNDIIDRDIDRQVARTALRPIPAGEVTARQAFVFAIVLSLLGFAVLIQFNRFAIGLGVASLLPVAVYPFMKRITDWPQAWLGLTFNWGALMGAAVVQASLTPAALMLYAGCIAWTLGYDTIYAHQDKEDDALIGVRSTALRFGRRTRLWVAGFYGFFAAALVAAGLLAELGVLYYTALLAVVLQLLWQIRRLDIDNASLCLRLFKSNIGLGWILFAGLLADRLLPL